MTSIQSKLCAILMIAATILLLGGVAAADAVTYHVNVDTSAIDGQSGYVDFSLLPSDFTSQSVTAEVQNFATNGTVSSNSPVLTGDASGLLPGTLTLDNATFFNDYFQDFTFGSALSFDLLLNGPALSAPDGISGGSSFTFGMYAPDQITPLLTTSPDGEALRIDVNSDGTTSVTTFDAGDGSGSVVQTAQAVPEPASLTLLLSGALGVLYKRKHRA